MANEKDFTDEVKGTVHKNPGCVAGGCLGVAGFMGASWVASMIGGKYIFPIIVGGLVCLYIFNPATKQFVKKTHHGLKTKIQDWTR